MLADDQQLIQLLKVDKPSWQGLSSSTAEQLLVRLVMFIERRRALPEVLPWLWPLADEDSGCKVNVKPSLQNRLLAALIAIPEAADTALGGKVTRLNMLDAKICCMKEKCVHGSGINCSLKWLPCRCIIQQCMPACMQSSVPFLLQ